jgi:hypothetical protein
LLQLLNKTFFKLNLKMKWLLSILLICFTIELIKQTECSKPNKVLKRRFPHTRVKKGLNGKYTNSKYADDCAQFKYYSQYVNTFLFRVLKPLIFLIYAFLD